MIPKEEYPESPCKTCLVYAICRELCPETNYYIEHEDKIDKYAGEILSRVVHHHIYKAVSEELTTEPTAVESNYWSKKIEGNDG